MSIDSTRRYHFTGQDIDIAIGAGGGASAKFISLFDLCNQCRGDVPQDLPMPSMITFDNTVKINQCYCFDGIKRDISLHSAFSEINFFSVPPKATKITVRFSFTNPFGDYLTPMLAVRIDGFPAYDLTHIGTMSQGRHVDAVLSIDLGVCPVARWVIPVLLCERATAGTITIADLYLTYEVEGRL